MFGQANSHVCISENYHICIVLWALYIHWAMTAHRGHVHLLTSEHRISSNMTSEHEPQTLCDMVFAVMRCGTLQKRMCTRPNCILFPAMLVGLMHSVSAAAQHSLLHLDVLWWTAAGAAIGFHHLCHHLLGRKVGIAEAEPGAQPILRGSGGPHRYALQQMTEGGTGRDLRGVIIFGHWGWGGGGGGVEVSGVMQL